MSVNLLDRVEKLETVSRDESLHKYRKMLLADDPKNAAAILKLGKTLGFSRDRLESDQEAVRLADQLETRAADADGAARNLEAAFGAAEEHRTVMTEEIAQLQEKQKLLDAEVSKARGRSNRADNAAQQLAELRGDRADLFADHHNLEAQAERDRLEAAVDELPTLREQLAEAEKDLEKAEALADAAIEKCYATAPQAGNKKAVIQSKADAEAHRNAIADRKQDLQMRISNAEFAQRRLRKGS